ncbi:putative bifunctional diguanylate cyclase/phosphodiesterase [Parasphingorhabdus pacifica]
MASESQGVGPPAGSGLDREFVDLALAVNDAVLWHYDQDQDELTWMTGMTELLAMPDATTDEVRSRLRELTAPLIVAARTTPTWEDLELEQEFVDPNGRKRSIHFRARRFSSAEKHGLVGAAADTTTAREDSEALADLADRYRLLVELSPDAICVHQDGVVVYVNPAAVKMTGVESENQVIGFPITDFVDADSLPEMHERLASLTYAGATSTPAEAQLTRFDGGTVLIESVSVRTTWRGRPAFQVILRDVTAQREAEATLRHQASHDELTGLLNRKGIKDVLQELAGDGSGRIALVFCDIDNFKRVNDSLGHEAGDELLTALSRRLQNELPSNCTVARLSGDEFLIVCPDAEAVGGLESLANLVTETLRIMVPLRGQLVSVSVSAGAATLGETMTGDDLLRYADMAMFHAKSRGPGKVSLASPQLITAGEGQLLLEGELRDAIRNDELELHYQPIVDRSGNVVEAEALVRWRHPERGLLAPNVILPVAEQGDLLRALDRWVLRTALCDAADWPEPAGHPIAVAVNLANLLPNDPEFVTEISTLIDECGTAWNRVVLEMVETALLDLSAQSRDSMTTLTERGARFAIDDFGTGYSSLARLKQMPAQIIKLDRQFVAGIEDDTVNYAIARAIADMALAMGHSCIAEGIETPGQLAILEGLGVSFYQGYLLSRPLPAEEFLDLIVSSGRLDDQLPAPGSSTGTPTPRHLAQDQPSELR